MIQVPRLLPALALALLLSHPRALTAQDSGRKQLATTGATCPIQLKFLQLHKNHLEFEYRNSSDKVLQGIVFGLAYYDSVQDPHRVVVVGGINRLLRPGKLWKSQLDVSYWRNSGYAGWTLWPAKILFADGSTWQMGHEVNACSVVNWLEKQITPPPLPNAVITMVPEHYPEQK
jgi:hypothetical protein